MAYQDLRPGDIRATLAVSQDEVQFGSSRVVNLPGGRTTTVIVPAGTRDGEELRLPGQGTVESAGGRPGDLILRVSVLPTDHFQPVPEDNMATQHGQNPYPPVPPVMQPPTNYAPYEGGAGSTVPAYAPPLNQPPQSGPQSYPGFNSYPNYPVYSQAAQPDPYAPQYYPPPQTPQPKPRRGGAITTLILVIVLLLLVGSGLGFYFGYYQPTQQHGFATQTAQSQVTGTANAQAQATAQIRQATANAAASSTAQVQATAQAYQTIYNQATGGQPVLNDPLNAQSSSQWDENNGGKTNGSCAFTGGSYHSSIPNAGFFEPCYAESSNFSNFAFQVDMKIVSGDEGGIIFRADSVNDKFYLFRVNVDGTYDLYLYVNNQGTQAQRLLTGSSGLVQGLNQVNEITLVARGANMYFYLNKQYLNSTNDNTYASGKIGVFGESATQATDVAFSNAKVWTL